MSPPTGTVTFLFTDIEGSTRLWDTRPEWMSKALLRHDAILSECIQQNAGHVFKTIGDAFCAAFPGAHNAVNAAIAVQKALVLGDEPLLAASDARIRVRMAMHTGEAEERNGDYFGPSLNRVARLLSVSNASQVLVSELTRNVLLDTLPAQVSLRDLGMHQLRGLRDVQRIWQLCVPDLPDEFPPLRSINPERHNLPQPLTTFVGRSKEIAELKKRLTEARLVTLTGSGGCGKTRVSLQVGLELVEEADASVWMVELASLTGSEEVTQAVATVFGVREELGRTLLQGVVDAIKPRKVLLILDNCEHVISACASLVERLLQGCPDLTVLATSREILGISGETFWRLPSLSIPDPGAIGQNSADVVESLEKYEAVELFIERARAIVPEFMPTPHNAKALAHLCYRLDGIPLALELAAARMKVMPVEQIAVRLDNRFRLLVGGSRTALPRHQTLRALIDWSYDLLTEPERILLRRLAIFRGGWSLEAAEVVCTGDSIESWEVLDLLTQLTDKSLVVYEERNDEARYRLLETVREYSSDKLVAAGEVEVMRSRHRIFYRDLAAKCNQDILTREQSLWLARLETEHDNIRAVLDGCAEDGDALTAVQTAGYMWRFWFFRSYLREGGERLANALRIADEAGIRHETTNARAGAGVIAYFHGDGMRAFALCSQSLIDARQIGDLWLIAISLSILGILVYHGGGIEEANALFEEGLTIARKLGDHWTIALCLSDAGFIRMQQGNLREAQEMCQEAVALARGVGEKWGLCNALYYLGNVSRSQGKYALARELLSEGLALSRELGQIVVSIWCLEDIGWAWGMDGFGERAALMLGAAEAFREGLGAQSSPANSRSYAENRASIQSRTGAEAFDLAWQAGRSLTRDDAFGMAMADN